MTDYIDVPVDGPPSDNLKKAFADMKVFFDDPTKIKLTSCEVEILFKMLALYFQDKNNPN